MFSPGIASLAQRGFALRRPGQGLAGFLAWEPGMSDIPVENPWQPESGYLEGISESALRC